MKLNEVLKIDCRNHEQKRELIDKFKAIDYVSKNLKSIKDDIEVEKICQYILEKMKFDRCCVFWRPDFKTSNIRDSKTGKLYTAYAITIKEMFIKMAVFAYYKRQKEKAERGEK